MIITYSIIMIIIVAGSPTTHRQGLFSCVKIVREGRLCESGRGQTGHRAWSLSHSAAIPLFASYCFDIKLIVIVIVIEIGELLWARANDAFH